MPSPCNFSNIDLASLNSPSWLLTRLFRRAKFAHERKYLFKSFTPLRLCFIPSRFFGEIIHSSNGLFVGPNTKNVVVLVYLAILTDLRNWPVFILPDSFLNSTFKTCPYNSILPSMSPNRFEPGNASENKDKSQEPRRNPLMFRICPMLTGNVSRRGPSTTVTNLVFNFLTTLKTSFRKLIYKYQYRIGF